MSIKTNINMWDDYSMRITIPKITFNEHFEKIEDKVTEECTVTKEEPKSCSNTYKGWEIVKMFDEGALPLGVKLINGSDKYEIKKDRLGNLIMYNTDCNEEACISEFVGEIFTMIKPKKFVSFIEALQQALNIKHRDWDTEYTTPQNILNHYTKLGNGDILNDLFSNEKVWEVQND